MDNYKETIKSLYLEGKTCEDIGEILGKTGKTISYHLKNMGIPIRSKKKIDQEKFEELFNEGKTDLEIAEWFKVAESTIKSFRTKGDNAGKFTRNNSFQKSKKSLSEIQEQMILGSLLGDMNLSIPGVNRMINSKLTIVHCQAQEELFLSKVNILGEFMGSYKLYNTIPDKRTHKIYPTYRGSSKAHPVFTELVNLVYPTGKKLITQAYLDRIYHPIALAYWFMDDGTERGTIATNSFSYDEMILLTCWLKDRFEIESTIQKNLDNFVLHISQKSRMRFEELIYPHIVESMKYKLQFNNLLAQSV